MTNREWLESLSDEELAEFLRTAKNCQGCVYGANPQDATKCFEANACTIGRIKWLKRKYREKK